MWGEFEGEFRQKVSMLPAMFVLAVVLIVADSAGVIHLSDADAAGRARRPGGIQHRSALPSRVARADIPSRYLTLYRKAGRAEGVSWPILAGVGKVESNHGQHMGPSSAGALGPMQFMPGTWRTWGRGGDVMDPADAIPAAARFLKALGINRNPEWALAAYNAGPGRADHPPASTRRYVANVRALARRYARR
jgi:membrane-bound lytic murein transglycosylase B